MASKRPSFMKRQRERDLKEKRQAKIERRQIRQTQENDKDPGAPGDPAVDPDIAHIQPGPQPIPWMLDYEPTT